MGCAVREAVVPSRLSVAAGRHGVGRWGPGALFRRRAHDGADAAELARLLAQAWDAAHDALAPIVGERGADALARRSLQLAGAGQPVLLTALGAADAAAEPAALQRALATQPVSVVVAAAAALLQTHLDLLASLIGASLTAGLLQPAWRPLNALTPPRSRCDAPTPDQRPREGH